MARQIMGEELFEPDARTCIGALPLYITNTGLSRLEPMNANFGIIEGLDERVRNKQERYGKIANRALEVLEDKLKEKC